MQQRSKQKPRGQALILIVFAIVGMVALTALAVDGGSVYSDRRHAQNAADTAALAAGLGLVRGYTNWDVDGYNSAASNGYPAGGVKVYQCSAVPAGQPACVLAPGEEHPENYVQVVITSTVKTYFAPIVGIRSLTNTVEAIAKAVPGAVVPWMNGSALVALMPGCQENNIYPFSIGGGQHSTVLDSGVFVNSSCPNGAFKQNQNSSIDAPKGICIVGGMEPNSDTSGDPVQPQEHCGTQLDLTQYKLPPVSDASCDTEGNGQIVDIGGGTKMAKPGRYSGTFPPGSANTLLIGQGIYCLKGGINITGNITVTTDLNGNSQPDDNEGALFFVENGDITIAGGSSTKVFLAAIPSGAPGIGPDLANYLFYVPPTNPNTIKLTGGSSNTYIGTILAPASNITLDGGSGSDSLDMQTQIIGYSINLTGGGNLYIKFDQSKNAFTWTNPQLTQYR